MARIVLACTTESVREKMTGLLSGAGLPVFRAVSSGNELKRILHLNGDGIVLIVGRLPDVTLDELADDLCERNLMMLLGRSAFLSLCSNPQFFRLELPCASDKIVGAVQMLIQLYEMRLPRRTGEDRDLVEQAKEHLMKEYGWTEPEAHRWLQQMAMSRRMKMTRCAALVLDSSWEGF